MLKLKNCLKIQVSLYTVVLTLIFCIGIFLRAKAYLAGYSMWLDECSLALSIMHRGIFGFFAPLEHVQSAPPFFMMATKILTNIFGVNEASLRFIPFFASICSLPLFYIFSKKILSKKKSLLIALLFFAVNFRLVYYGVEFKQYSFDVFMALMAFLCFSALDLDKTGVRKIFLYGILSFTGFLFSLPVIFITGAFVLCNFSDFKNLNKQKVIKIFIFLLPFIILLPVYYIFFFYPSQYELMNIYGSLWYDGFLTLNLANIVHIIKINLVYFFNQENFTLFTAVLLIAGLALNIRNAKSSKDSMLLCFVLLCAIVASCLHIYPIKERVALYLLPFLLVLIVKPLDCVAFKHKFKSAFAVIFFILFANGCFSYSYYKDFYPQILRKKGDGTKFMQILKANYKADDIVVYNDASDSIYKYNSMRQNFSTARFIQINLADYGKEFYTGLLNQLPKGHTYWFYYPYDYHKKTVIPFVRDWAKPKHIEEEHLNDHSYFLKVKI